MSGDCILRKFKGLHWAIGLLFDTETKVILRFDNSEQATSFSWPNVCSDYVPNRKKIQVFLKTQ